MKKLFLLAVACLLLSTVSLSAQTVSTFAGKGPSSGYTNGAKANAKFNNPYGICFDSAGNLFIVDTHNQRIRKLSTSGLVSFIAGSGNSGTNNGKGAAADFDDPKGICMDKNGNLYVVDAISYLVRKITPNGTVSTLCSYDHTSYCGVYMCIDTADNLYLADNGANRVQKISTVTGKLTNYAGDGTSSEKDGNLLKAKMNGPNGICIDKAQNLYVTDLWSNSIRKITPSGNVTTIAGNNGAGFRNGNIAKAQFTSPHSIVVDENTGLIYVAELNDIRIIDTVNGIVSRLAGDTAKTGYIDGPTSKALLNFPHGLAIKHSSPGLCGDTTYLYFADCYNNVIRRIDINHVWFNPKKSSDQTTCSNSIVGLGDSSNKKYSCSWAPSAYLSDSAIANPSFQYSNSTSSDVSFDYTLTISDGMCTVSDSIKVVVHPQVAQPTISKHGDTLSASTASSYQWYKDSTLITSANAKDYIPSNSGNYKVKVYDANGCTNTSNASYFTVINTIQGKVTQSNGKPLASSRIYLLYLNTKDTTVTALDSARTDSLGNYSIVTKDSLLYVLAFPDSASYPMEIPTYYDSAIDIQYGKSVRVKPGINTVNFSTIKGYNQGGHGFIGGKITICSLCKKGGAGSPVTGLTVILKGKSGSVLMITKTDANGFFSFKNIPVEDYSIWIDKPFIDNSLAPQIQLTSSTPVKNNLAFNLHPEYLELSVNTSIEDAVNETQSFSIFPNPFSASATVNYNLIAREAVLIELIDMVGRHYSITNGFNEAGNHQVNVNVKELNLKSGIYTLRIQTGKSTSTIR